MKQSEILSIATKIFGIYYFVQFVRNFLDLFSVVFQHAMNGFQSVSGFVYISICLLIVVDFTFAYVATFRTDIIVNRISKFNSTPLELILNKTDWIEVALVAIGIIAMTFGIPEILYQVIEKVYFHNSRQSDFLTVSKKSEIFRSIFKLASGLFLILNARNFAKNISRKGELDDKLDEKAKR